MTAELAIRPLVAGDQAALWEWLHVALWDPPPAPLRPREVLQHPAVSIYAQGWGREGDVGVVGEVGGKAVGACWLRRIRGGAGLGYVDDDTPQLGIALLPEYRGRGFGRRLMRAALDAARAQAYAQVSLTVHPLNPAIALYESCGFRKREVRNTYHLMVCTIAPMYTLYYSPGSCALIINCLMEEMGVPFEARKVDIAAGEHHGEAYRKLNPKGKVPVLVTPEGSLTECLALIEYLCDRHDTERRFLPAPGTWARARTMERLATLSTEIHNNLGNRFFHEDGFSDDPAVRAAVKANGAEKLTEFFRAEDARLTGDYWSGGSEPDASDFYFMVVARWGRWLEDSALRMPNIERFFRRMTARPAVARAMEREGIKPFGT